MRSLSFATLLFLAYLDPWAVQMTRAQSFEQHEAGEIGVDSTSFAVCMKSIRHAEAIGISGAQVVFKGDGDIYDSAKRTWNKRCAAEPLAVFFAHHPDEVAAAVRCAYKWHVPVSPAGGRHNYQGAAIVDNYLVIDMTNLTQISIDPDQLRMTVGAGNQNSMVAAALQDSGIPGAAFPGGFCPWVGIGGWTLGGGIGVLSRYLGLGCDQLLGVHMVLPNGTAVYASKDSHPDLLWASCGGGGGTFGIATAFDFKISILPNNGELTYIYISYAPGKDNITSAFMRFQEWLPNMDKRFGFFVQMIYGRLQIQGVFVGQAADSLDGLTAAGMLASDLPLDETMLTDEDNSDYVDQYPFGAMIKQLDSYYQYTDYQIWSYWLTPNADYNIPWRKNLTELHKCRYMRPPPAGGVGRFPGTPEEYAYVHKVAQGAPGLRVMGGQLERMWTASFNRMTGILPLQAVQAMASIAVRPPLGVNDTEGRRSWATFDIGTPTYATWFWVLGGAIMERETDSTAFHHRKLYYVIDTAVRKYGALPTPQEASQYSAMVEDFGRALRPYLQKPEAAYINYL